MNDGLDGLVILQLKNTWTKAWLCKYPVVIGSGNGAHACTRSWKTSSAWIDAQTLFWLLWFDSPQRNLCCGCEQVFLCTVDCDGLKSPLTHVENSHFVLAPHTCCLISKPSRAEEALCSFWLQDTFNDSLPPSKYRAYLNQQNKVIGFLSCSKAEIWWLSWVWLWLYLCRFSFIIHRTEILLMPYINVLQL